MNNNQIKGISFALITAIISGIAIFYNKIIIVSGIEPLTLNILKNSGSAIILSFLLITSSTKQDILKLKRNDWAKLFLIALLGGSLPFILYFEGLKHVSVANANLIHKTLFIWVAAMAIPILGERLSFIQVLGYILLVWGNIFFSNTINFPIGHGELLIFSATILWSLENIIAKFALKNIDPKIVGWARMFLGIFILGLFAISQNKLNLIFNVNPRYILPIGVSSILLASYVTSYFKALKFAPATLVTSILILATPVANILYSVFILHNLPQSTFISSLFILGGIILIVPLAKKMNIQK